ncbi:CCA tRNA nucleotidyltransferase [Paenibacillus eucommiae]|uniref:tRNA nucleotidyltransferase (CCA-adding enzyme) n=1 Tax=Paenibacillus eucommiae TaxID=1355755 RepID=A0ABS4J4J8_9BACL|nr:CCA tRNA nucleotidyltransferase [Paenibacillus eucommiae]MBP1994764.1 tRNA nucleotidyltransferase (CCA-adding enzyme) [Paenibacillus eucommiae]
MQQAMEQEGKTILQHLQEQGYEAYFVGGCVRDKVLGRSIKDFDIATSALPEQVMASFPRIVPTGLQHGTVTVIMKHGAYEVTTFRAESQYEDHRRPQEVTYISSLTQDLRRRDFTINAMAMNQDGEIFDPFGGREDLAAGLLRCVGEAEERFGEDALRMLRCLRFASVYGLEVESQTWQALLRQAPLLRHVAMERVRSELQSMLAGPAPAQALRLLLASRLWQHFKRQLSLPFEMWLAQPAALDAVGALEEHRTRWALLLLLLEMPTDVVRSALQELTFSRADTDAVAGVLALYEQLARQLLPDAAAAPADLEPRQLSRLWKVAAVAHGLQPARDLLQVLRVLLPSYDAAQAASDSVLARFMHDAASLLAEHGSTWLEEMPCSTLKELAVNGSDLVQALDRPAGPWIGQMLYWLLEQVALGELLNDRTSLLLAIAEADPKLYS